MIAGRGLWRSVRAAGLALAVTGVGCRGERVSQATVPAEHFPALADVTPAQWDRLAGRKIFFGHQSVGGNILDGVRAVVADNQQIRLRLVHSREPASVDGPALIDAFVGQNADPASKSADFEAMLAHGLGAAGGVAMYKFCYVDVSAVTDPAALLQQYRESVERVKAQNPNVTIIHVTVPLKVVAGEPSGMVARIRSSPTEADAEANRVAYNRLLVQAYANEPIFDLARVESTRPDGSRSYFVRGETPIYTLAEEWSADGGHLNPAGQRFVAEQFLIFLARL